MNHPLGFKLRHLLFALLILPLLLGVDSCPPQVISIAPTMVAAGSPAFTLTVTGKNFQPGAVLVWTASDGTKTTLTPASISPDGTQMEVLIPANLVAKATTDDGKVQLARALGMR